MKSTTSSLAALVLKVATVAIFTQGVSGQSGEDVCFAPVGEAGSIGNVSFEAPISSSSLYWIASVRHDNNRLMTRQFHLFTEDRSVEFGTEESNFHGCGLAMTGVMKTDRADMLPEVDGQGDPGCASILGQECADEVIRRAREELSNVLRNSTATATAQQVRRDVRNRLFTSDSSFPEGCEKRVWASISDIVLTGDSADVLNTTYVEGESDCADHSQVSDLYEQGNTFALFPLASFQVPQDGDLDAAREWTHVATPMLSLFWAKDGVTAVNLDDPAISLNCVAATNATKTSVPKQESNAASTSQTTLLARPLALMLVALMLAH